MRAEVEEAVRLFDGDAMLRARKTLGDTQAEFGERLDFSSTYIGQMERGCRAIERRTKLALFYVMFKAGYRSLAPSGERVDYQKIYQ